MSSAAATAPPPDLLERLRRDGLRVDDVGDGPVAATTGDLAAELRAAREGAAILWAHGRGALEVTGEDRASYLQRMLTQGLLSAGPGDLRRSLLLDRKGRIVADLDLAFDDDRILGITAPDAVAETIETLQRYVLRAQVHLRDLRTSHVVLRLVGPDADEVLRSSGAAPPRADAATLEPGATAVRVTRSPRALPGGYELLVEAGSAATLWSTLVEGGDGPRARPIGAEADEVLRIEAGVPAHGAELTASEFPQEARLDAAVDYDKGCYLGQETVARIHYRGKVNRLLSGLESPRRLGRGTGLVAEEREVGSVTSAARLPSGDWLGLGYVRVEHAEPGTELEIADGAGDAATDGGSARVREIAWWGGSESPAGDPASTS